jgi:hypothetical protein
MAEEAAAELLAAQGDADHVAERRARVARIARGE